MAQVEVGKLIAVEYSDSGNSLGNMYRIETSENDQGEPIVTEYNSPMHSDPATIREYRAPEDLIDRISAIVDEAGMKDWGDLPMSEFIPLDASTPRITLVFEPANSESRFPVRINFSTWDELPEGGTDSFNAVRNELQACLVEENLIREYMEERR